MKQKILKNSLLLFLFGIIMVSCELQEEAIHQHEHNSKVKLYEMKFEELMTNKRFVNSFSKLPKSKKSLTTATVGRTVMENEYGFTIANKPAKVIDDNGNTSYTFLITRDSTDANSFENLVIQTDSTNTTKAVIMKYILTSPITSSADDSYSFTYNREITPIVYNSSPVSESSKMIIICYWITTTYCNNTVTGEIGPEHIAGEKCRRTYTRSIYRCTAGDDGTVDNIPMGDGGADGGGGGTATPDSNYDGSDTSIHGNGGNNINTAPVAPEVEEIVEDPCQNLNNKIDPTKANLKQDIIELQQKVNQNGEYGKSLSKDLNGNYSSANVPNTSDLKIKIPYAGFYYGSIHTHPYLISVPMFSWTDVFSLQLFLQEALVSNQTEITIILVCKDSSGILQTYALVIDDPDTLYNSIVNDIQSNISSSELANIPEEDKQAFILNKMDEKLTETYSSFQNKELAFLSRFSNYGISLFKSNNEITSWSKLVIQNPNSLNADVAPIPCN